MKPRKQKTANLKKIRKYSKTRKSAPKKTSSDKKNTKSPTTTNVNQLDVIMLKFSMHKNSITKRFISDYGTKRDIDIKESVVKKKSGGFSLKIEKTFYKFNHKKGDQSIGETEVTYLKTIGLLNFLGSNVVWKSDMTFLPRTSKRKFKTEGHIVRNKHLEGTKSQHRVKTTIPKKTVENTITAYTTDIGMQIGISIHSEIEKYIISGPEIFQKICPNPDPLTIAIISALGARKYVGIDAEFPLYFKCIETNRIIASSVDFVCTVQNNTRTDIVLVELKTGYSNGTFYTSFQKNTNENLAQQGVHIYGDNQMLSPFSDLKDTPLNRGRIQLVTYMMYFKEKLKTECSGSVLHCSSDGVVKFFDIGDEFYYKYSKFVKSVLCLK